LVILNLPLTILTKNCLRRAIAHGAVRLEKEI
jgi:hypothetical protein